MCNGVLTVIIREMALGANFCFLNFLHLFAHPGAISPMGTISRIPGAIIQFHCFIQGFARHLRCHLSGGCDAELVNATHGLARQRCCRQ